MQFNVFVALNTVLSRYLNLRKVIAILVTVVLVCKGSMYPWLILGSVFSVCTGFVDLCFCLLGYVCNHFVDLLI